MVQVEVVLVCYLGFMDCYVYGVFGDVIEWGIFEICLKDNICCCLVLFESCVFEDFELCFFDVD